MGVERGTDGEEERHGEVHGTACCLFTCLFTLLYYPPLTMQLASMGAAAFLSYGVCSNLTYCTCISIAWIAFVKQVS
jgi:hypothetical protein